MNVTLMAHTQLSEGYSNSIYYTFKDSEELTDEFTSGQAIALSAIRTCYSANKPSEIVAKEGAKYFGNKATDGAAGTEADRLIRQIVASKHLSTVEHLTFTFAVEGVSRALLAQLTRHRVGFSFSVQSQRYVRFGSADRSGGFDYVTPDSVEKSDKRYEFDPLHGIDASVTQVFDKVMRDSQEAYDLLRSLGIPAEDARAVLPQAAACNLVMTANLRSLLDFYVKRKAGNGAQGEIAALAERLKDEVVAVEPWTESFFK
ncbi:FAD-dependent thymidylate synthase [uncultured Planococcus sp.]|uniref:FAD-dependent thymidylate synthase n=1 Tax=uncultured Planococcus sp. TaxID=337815 RepID=UPI00260410A0|nr:FAD-dependent thymidylate synthase [uncultured Planococcus sp.]